MSKKIGRNDPCPCGSGKKYKKCCLPTTGPGLAIDQAPLPEEIVIQQQELGKKHLICGVTIDVEPKYKDAASGERCRAVLWKDEDVGSKFQEFLQRNGTAGGLGVVRTLAVSENSVYVQIEVNGFLEPEDEVEVFTLEINFFGDRSLHRSVFTMKRAMAMGERIAQYLREVLPRFGAEHLPGEKISWQVKMDGYDEP